jgi:aryl sulfotransferase
VTARTVWLASYPKSGNTWLRAVVTAWRSGGHIDLNDLDGGPMPSTRAPFDEALGIPSSSMTPDEADLLRPRADEVRAADASEPYLLKIHDAYLDGPAGEPIVSLGATRAALYMIRDPRDVAVSYAHHRGMTLEWTQRHLSDPEAAMSGYADRLEPQLRQRLGTWSEHVASWVDRTPFPVHVVRYEDCAANPVETFARALRFAGFAPVEDARVAEAVEHARFDRLRRAEEERGFIEQPPGAADFFRRGETGSWREDLPAGLAARIEADHGEVMARFGYL